MEEDTIKTLQDFLELNSELKLASSFFNSRLKVLTQSGKYKGLGNNLFMPTLRNRVLKLRSGFAFAPFASGQAHNTFISQSKQSEIYFIISSIINDLRNKNILFQTEYVRNIIDPGNFIRYNDGLIQACILRAATNEELNYSLSADASQKMKSILGDMILHLKDDHAEALLEFFYAIAAKKLRLLPACLEDCVKLLEQQEQYKIQDSILKGIVEYIKSKILSTEDVMKKFTSLPKAIDESID